MAELDNLRAALDWCSQEPGEAEAGLTLMIETDRLWAVRGLWFEAQELLKALLARAPEPTLVRADALAHYGGFLATYAGTPETARPIAEEAVALSEALGFQRGLRKALVVMGMTYLDRADLVQARIWYERALAVARESGDPSHIAPILNNLAVVAALSEQLDEAHARFEEALQQHPSAGDLSEATRVACNLGILWGIRGNHERALTCAQQGLEFAREAGDKEQQAFSLQCLAARSLAMGDLAAAGRYLVEGLALGRELGLTKGTIFLLENATEWLALRGDAGRAVKLYGAYQTLFATLGIPQEHVIQGRMSEAMDGARTQLGENAYLIALGLGKTLSWKEVRWPGGHPSPSDCARSGSHLSCADGRRWGFCLEIGGFGTSPSFRARFSKGQACIVGRRRLCRMKSAPVTAAEVVTSANGGLAAGSPNIRIAENALSAFEG